VPTPTPAPAAPAYRLRFALREVQRLRDDAEAWQADPDPAARDQSPWEDLAAKARFLFGQILDLDGAIQRAAIAGDLPPGLTLRAQLDATLGLWLRVAEATIVPALGRLPGGPGAAPGAEDFLASVAEARAWLEYRRGECEDLGGWLHEVPDGGAR
jgi:hypothetical protein